MDNEELKEWLKTHFADNYQRWLFELSMDGEKIAGTSIKSLCNFIAHGVALIAAQDDGYLMQCAEVHQRLTKMASALEKHPIGRQDLAYQSAMIVGSIIEMAITAIQKLRK
jgi:hypothetical protein